MLDDPDAPIDPDARNMALRAARGVAWPTEATPREEGGGDDGSIEPACTDAPDGARGDAKMHSAPSHFDGVEHTLASVAAAAAATALRRHR